MGLKPVLFIKSDNNSVIKVRTRLRNDTVEHEIILNSILAYYWSNNLPAVEKFIELYESVIKRTINELIPHKDLYLKYQIKANQELDKATDIEIKLIEVKADDLGFKIDGESLILKDLGTLNADPILFNETIEKNIETPDIVLKKYMEMKG